MLPWRPLGMLAFGLAVIFLFIRLHGDGFDFPVTIVRCKDELDFWSTPDRTYLETSGLDDHHPPLWDTPLATSPHADGSGSSKTRHRSSVDTDTPSQGQMFMGTMHLGTKKAQDGALEYEDEQHQQWVWMTTIWHEVSECGPGYLRQYRRRLDLVLTSNKSSPWELMYTHRFPGPITHSSISKRILPDDTISSSSGKNREAIRLAVVYKVVEDERAEYHTRVYHFGVFQHVQDLKEGIQSAQCGETCHVHAPFLSFDYILPGSTPIKDFSLEHDMLLYSRLSDTALFRTIQLPALKAGATSPERPYSLTSGSHGPSSSCEEKRNVPYRMSYLATIPTVSESKDLHVMMGQVQEYHRTWKYQVSIGTEVNDLKAGSKKWVVGKPWLPREYESLVQENDMINDEPHTYGVSVQKPYLIKSVDGTSMHIPIKSSILSLETQRTLLPPAVDDEEDSYLGSLEKDDDNAAPQKRDQEHIQAPRSQKRKPNDRHSQLMPKVPNLKNQGQGKKTHKQQRQEEHWVDFESHISAGTLESIDTDQGVINDAADVIALKTTHNGVLILRRDQAEETMRGHGPWHLQMIMTDREYNSLVRNRETAKREMLAMKLITVPVPIYENHEGESTTTTVNTPLASPALQDRDPGSDRDNDSPLEDASPKSARYEVHNVLLVVFGSGWMFGHDLDRATEASAVVLFLEEKYAVVIGMLAVVIAFVINEAR
ncbi:hypothetical protein EDD11_003218 [Mortierella claussenii]|nr:hypothetical protein EDD11_003218 [Mortierella claussenii]